MRRRESVQCFFQGVGRDVRRYRLRWGWEDGESLNPVSDTPVFVKEVF